jgi:hypothetical protein
MVASALKIMNQERNIPSTATKQNEKENYNENHTQIPNSYGSTNNFLESTRERSSKASDSSCSLQSLGGTKRVVETREEVDSRLEQTPLLQSTSSDSHKSSTMQFLLLLLFLLFSCLVGILIVLWKLISGEISGIFIGVNVLDTTTNFGQGFFVFIVFGFERHWFWMALYKRVRRILFKIESVHIPVESDLSSTVKALCLEFKQQHLAECRHAIESDKRYYAKVYQGVVVGSDLVDWLLEKGLVRTREDATQYGQSLLLGRVLTHVTHEHYFYDDNYFYRFTV